MIKFLKRSFYSIAIVLVLCFIFRGYLYRACIAYASLGEKQNYLVENTQMIKLLEADTPTPEVKSIIKHNLKITSSNLSFTFDRCSNNPNEVVNSKSANCVGYAAFFSTSCNYYFNKNAALKDWVAVPQIGQLYFFGYNIHHLFSSPFYKDHDFVIIKNIKTAEKYAVDPSFNDYFWIDFVTLKQ